MGCSELRLREYVSGFGDEYVRWDAQSFVFREYVKKLTSRERGNGKKKHGSYYTIGDYIGTIVKLGLVMESTIKMSGYVGTASRNSQEVAETFCSLQPAQVSARSACRRSAAGGSTAHWCRSSRHPPGVRV